MEARAAVVWKQRRKKWMVLECEKEDGALSPFYLEINDLTDIQCIGLEAQYMGMSAHLEGVIYV